MRAPFVPVSQQSVVPAGTAATWCFDRRTVLVVVRGTAWITVEGAAGAVDPQGSLSPRGGDWFLASGATLQVEARRRLLIEPAGTRGEAAVLACYGEAVPLVGPGQRTRAGLRSAGTAIRQAARNVFAVMTPTA